MKLRMVGMLVRKDKKSLWTLVVFLSVCVYTSDNPHQRPEPAETPETAEAQPDPGAELTAEAANCFPVDKSNTV